MKKLRDSSGQMTVEIVLLAIVLVGLGLMIGRYIKDNQLVSELVQQPWTSRLAGMIENGAWGTVAATRALHPNSIDRHSSLRGDPP